MPMLFVSFTGLLCGMRINKVTEEDLNRGLFYFGCTRAHIFEPEKDRSNEVQLTFQDDPAFGQECHRRIKEAVKAAEKEGRAEFRSGQCTYKQLNDFLTRNGYPPVAMSDADSYSYPAVMQAVADLNTVLKVFYNGIMQPLRA